MTAGVALAFGLAGTLAAVLGLRLLLRAHGRTNASVAGAVLLLAVSALVMAVAIHPVAWLIVVALVVYGISRAVASIAGAARGRVGAPLSPEQTRAFLERAERDPAIAAISEVVPSRPGRPRTGDAADARFDDEAPPSL